MFDFQCYLVAAVLHIQSSCSRMCVCVCVCVHILHSIRIRGGQKNKKKIGTAVNAECHFWNACCQFASPGIVGIVPSLQARQLRKCV